MSKSDKQKHDPNVDRLTEVVEGIIKANGTMPIALVLRSERLGFTATVTIERRVTS